jgi:F-type H+-transporting ATPase subunit b
MSDATGFYEQVALWSQILGSAAFIVSLVYIFTRFLTPAVAASQERKNAELVEAERRRDAAKEELAAIKRELEGVESEAAAIRKQAEADARKERERILADALAEGERLVSNAQGELDRGRLAACQLLRAELVDKALTIARRHAGEQIDPAKNREIVAGVMDAIDHAPPKALSV